MLDLSRGLAVAKYISEFAGCQMVFSTLKLRYKDLPNVLDSAQDLDRRT
jgi:hypothetical protein